MSHPDQQSILYQSLRSFFRTIFAMAGFGIGLLFILMAIGLFLGSLGEKTGVDATTNVHVLVGADGTRKVLQSKSPLILQIDIVGAIGTEKLTMDKVRTLLTESREGSFADNRIKALLLNIRSPGGSVIDSDAIYLALKQYKELYNVPIYVYVDGLCASGGMYIASAADKIYASEVSLVGSIGVIGSPFMNFSELMGKVGVKSMTVFKGEGKDNLNPLRDWKPEEADEFQKIVDVLYGQFTNIVLNARPKVDRDKLENEYGARIFPAERALEIGYIDELANSISPVIEALATEAEIADKGYQVIRLAPKYSIGDLFGGQSSLFDGRITHEHHLGSSSLQGLSGQFLYLWHPGS